jgi:hypothetical protein
MVRRCEETAHLRSSTVIVIVSACLAVSTVARTQASISIVRDIAGAVLPGVAVETGPATVDSERGT